MTPEERKEFAADVALGVSSALNSEPPIKTEPVTKLINNPLAWLGVIGTCFSFIFALSWFIYEAKQESQDKNINSIAATAKNNNDFTLELQLNQKLLNASVQQTSRTVEEISQTVKENIDDISGIKSTRVKPDDLKTTIELNLQPLRSAVEAQAKRIEYLEEKNRD